MIEEVEIIKWFNSFSMEKKESILHQLYEL
jgi:hypothetical protein